MNILVYVSCHDRETHEEAKALVDSSKYKDCFKIVKFESQSKDQYLFENQIFNIMYEEKSSWKAKDFVGVITYKFTQKTQLSLDQLIESIVQFGPQTDIISYFNIRFINMAAQLEVPFVEACCHQHGPYLHTIIARVLEAHGYNEDMYMDNSMKGFFCNFWVTTPKWMKQYIKFFQKSKQIIETSPILNKYIHNNSYYTGNLSKERLKALTGKEYYTLHAFVFERLPCFYFHVEKARLTQFGVMLNYGLKL